MRVFLTGATGFIGAAVAQELIRAGHSVLGVARTEAGATALRERGIEPHFGDLMDHDSFIDGARLCDAVAHCAFIHDFSKFMENMEIERATVSAMLDALEGSGRPFVATSGVAGLAPGRMASEEDTPARQGRGATEALVRGASARGLKTAVIRLPPITHENGAGGFLPPLADIARETGKVAYVGDGANRWPTGNRADAAVLYRLALEGAEPGSAYHAVGEEGVTARAIAEALAKRLGLPTISLAPEEAMGHFGWIGMFAALDMPASSRITQERLGWRPTHRGLLEDIASAPTLGTRLST